MCTGTRREFGTSLADLGTGFALMELYNMGIASVAFTCTQMRLGGRILDCVQN
jgi:hypothetical protein